MNAKAQALTPAAINRALDKINRNPAGRDAGMFTNLDAPKNARTRYFKHATDSWALDNGFPYRLISSVTADGIGAPIQFLKTRAIVAVDESESGTPITETWKISGLKFFDSRSANPARKTRAVRVVAANPKSSDGRLRKNRPVSNKKWLGFSVQEKRSEADKWIHTAGFHKRADAEQYARSLHAIRPDMFFRVIEADS